MLDGKIEQSGQIGERQIVKAGERGGGGSDPIRNTMCVRGEAVRAGRKGRGVRCNIIQAITCIMC